MEIIITEEQQLILEKKVKSQALIEKTKKVEEEKFILEEYIEKKGEYMTDITNGKTYLVLYLKTLSEMVGNKYAVCASVRSDGTYGAFYVKPWSTFEKKGYNPMNSVTEPMKLHKNMYQKLGLNK